MSLSTIKNRLLEAGFDESRLPALQNYVDLLWSSNEEMNLISRKMTMDELLQNHVLDCVLPLKFMPKGLKEIADFGSGGGLPGIIYAIQFPRTKVGLFEKSPKKREFLEKCRAIAENLNINGEIPKSLPSTELVTARAFKPIDVILDVSSEYYRSGGKYFLLKGRREKIDEELDLARKKFKDLKAEIEPLKSPVLDVERNLVLISKA